MQYSRGNCVPQVLYYWVIGPVNHNLSKLDIDFSRIIYISTGKNLSWFYPYKDNLKYGIRIADRLINSDKFKNTYLRIWKYWQKKNISFTEEIVTANLKQYSNKALYKSYTEFSSNYLHFANLGMPLDGVDEALEVILPPLLNKLIPSTDHYAQNILLTPTKPTYLQKEELSLLTIARKIKDKLVRKRKDALIMRHYNEFWWISLGWGYVEIQTIADIKTRIKQLLNFTPEQLDQKIKEARNFPKNIKRKKSEIKRKYHLPEKISSYLELIEKIAVLHDWRKEIQMKAMYASRLLLREFINRQRQISFNDLLWCTPEEINEVMINKAIDWQEVRSRQKYLYCEATRGKFIVLGGQKAKDKQLQVFGRKNFANIDKIKGIAASPGKARGIARVSHQAGDILGRLKQGNVLITSMTTPDFAPAMKRASAVVTDEGGITCHAAIISRELGKPCIIGTKIGTKVFKDGDKVEVDANSGYVKKLRNEF